MSLAWDEWLHRPVAIKRVRKSDDKGVPQERLNEVFDAERRLSPQLVHPRIVVTYESDANQVVMEYLNGPTLKKYILGSHPHGLSLAVTMRYLTDLLDVAAFLHVGKIAHRDFNPGNIILHDPRMLTRKDLDSLGGIVEQVRDYTVIKVLDFGISTSTAKTSTNTPGKKARCPPFGPPEADPKERGDLYQLGALGIFMLSGDEPSSGSDSCPEEWLAILDDLYGKRRVVSRRLYKVLRKAIARDPSKRYETAEEFRTALLACVEGAERRHEGQNALVDVRSIGPLFVLCASLIVVGENAVTCLVAKRDPGGTETRLHEGDVDIVSRIPLPLPPLQETCPEITGPEMIEMWNRAKTYNEDVWGRVQVADVDEVKQIIQDLNAIVLAYPRCDATLALRGQLCLVRVRTEHDINNDAVLDQVREQLIHCKLDLEDANAKKKTGRENVALVEINGFLERGSPQHEVAQKDAHSQALIEAPPRSDSISTMLRSDGAGGSRLKKRLKDGKGDAKVTTDTHAVNVAASADTPQTPADAQSNAQSNKKTCTYGKFGTTCK